MKIFKLLLGEISNHLSEALAFAKSRGGAGDASGNPVVGVDEDEDDDEEDEGWEDDDGADGDADAMGMEQQGERKSGAPSSAFYLSQMLNEGKNRSRYVLSINFNFVCSYACISLTFLKLPYRERVP